MKIELGPGKNPYDPAAFGIDKKGYRGIDIVANLEYGIPLKDNSVSKIYAYHVLEHIENFVGLMEEIYRVLKDGGVLQGKVPHYKDPSAYHDPTHKQLFSDKTFDYWCILQDYNDFGYFPGITFQKEYCYRVRRLQIWKERPIKFKLHKIQNRNFPLDHIR